MIVHGDDVSDDLFLMNAGHFHQKICDDCSRG